MMNLISIMENFQVKEHLDQLKNVKVILIKNNMLLKEQNNKKDKLIFKKLKLDNKSKIFQML